MDLDQIKTPPLDRNSWMPVLATLVVLLLLFTLIHGYGEQGRGGPPVNPGIYPMGELYILSTDEVAVSNRIVEGVGVAGPVAVEDAVDPASDASATVAPPADHRVGLEVVPWDEVTIALEDSVPFTRTVAKALGEHLSGYLALHGAQSPIAVRVTGPDRKNDVDGRLVLMQPYDDQQLLPIPTRRVIRLRTLAGALPERPGAPFEARLAVTLHDALRPSIAERSGLAPAGGIAERAFVLEHRSEAAADAEVGWSAWHATVGRSVAADVLAALFEAERPPLDWDAPRDRARAIDARHGTGFGEGSGGWAGVLPWPTREGVERWYAGFQTPLLRGWSGWIEGHDTEVKGERRATIGIFAEQVAKGSWTQEVDAAGERLWTAADERAPYDLLHARQRPYGWELVSLASLPQPLAVHARWLQEAAEGDAVARAQLRRHLLASGLAGRQQDEAVRLLREDPDAAELAVLGRMPQATPAERRAALAVAFARGIDTAAPDTGGLARLGGGGMAWDGRPLLFVHGDAIAVLVRDAYGRVELRARSLRDPARRERVQGMVDGRLLLGEVAPVAITSEGGGLRISPR